MVKYSLQSVKLRIIPSEMKLRIWMSGLIMWPQLLTICKTKLLGPKYSKIY